MSIFISYSRQDQAYVDKLVQALSKHRLPYWIDNKIDYGATWPREIEENLKRCSVFLLVMSPRSEKSDWVGCELAKAIEFKKHIFPLLLEGTVWFQVANKQSVDVKGGKLPPDKFFDTVRSKLGSEVNVRYPRNEVVLKSERGIDYTKLRDLLAQGKWKEADEETAKVMLQAGGRENQGWLGEEDIDKFPREDLRTINQLWLHYSNGKFGFSVQKEIYESLGGTREYNEENEEVWIKFGERVGWVEEGVWLNYSELTFDLELASPAHLPCGLGWRLGETLRCWVLVFLSLLFSRVKTCNLVLL